MAAPPVSLGGYDIQTAVDDVIERVGGLDGLLDGFITVENVAGKAIGILAVAGGSSTEIAAGEVAGEAVVGFVGWWVLLIIIALIVILRLTESWLVFLAYKVPLFGSRSIGPAIKNGFMWLDKLENAVISAAEEMFKKVLHAFRMLVFYSLGIDPAALTNLLGQTNTDHGVVTQAQVNHLQSEINYLRHHLGEVTYVTQDKTVVTPIPQNLWDQVHHLEAQYYLLHKDVTALATQVQLALHTATSTEHQQQELAKEVHDVRAIAVGWQDIAHELDSLGTQLTHYISTTTTDLARLHQRQVQMEPLTLLLQPGIAGLRNLRKLEDKMCQCPKMPGLPDLMPDTLAVYEFLTNG